MNIDLLRSVAWIALLVLLVTVGTGNGAAAQDAVWRITSPPGALMSCSEVTAACVHLTHMVVKKTPGDPGSVEEWTVKLTASPGNFSKPKYVEVKDNYSGPGLTYNLGLQFCVPKQYGAFELRVGGHEEDMWPNPNDPIPTLRIIVVNKCSVEEVQGVTDEVDRVSRCKKTADGREACYYFKGDYQ